MLDLRGQNLRLGNAPHQSLLGTFRAQLLSDLVNEVTPHFAADGKHVIGADALRRRGEQPIVEQVFGWLHHGRRCAGGEQQGQQQE